MADIFISYSKQDQEEAHLLATFLEAEGYSVWWDTSLLSGESFRKVIMTELGRARAVIVIWTEHSIHSDWVQSEAGRAHADRKLIPVKAKGLAYKEIPPPFDNMHIENLGEREKILGAVVAQLAKPEVRATAFGLLSKHARFELLSWFGIIGATMSLVANLQGLLAFARWLRGVMDSWTLAFNFLWQKILFFLPKVYGSDSVMLTFIAFAAVNMLVCLRKAQIRSAHAGTFIAIVAASCVIIVLFYFGMERLAKGETFGEQGYYFAFLLRYARKPMELIQLIKPEWLDALLRYTYGVVALVVVPLVPVVILYLLVRKLADVRLSFPALSVRLWRILAGIGLLLAVN